MDNDTWLLYGIDRPERCILFNLLPIHKDHQKFLKFKFKGTLYQYTCLPTCNGLSSAPRIFTKLLKPVYSTLWGMGHLVSGYFDDDYTSREICHHPKPDPCVLGVYIKLFNHDYVANSTQGGNR